MTDDSLYENAWYDRAIDYSKTYAKTPSLTGYNKPETNSQADLTIIQQNNTIISLLSSLHYRITKLEITLDKLRTSTPPDLSNTIDQLTQNLSKLDLGPSKTRHLKKPTLNYLYYGKIPSTTKDKSVEQ